VITSKTQATAVPRQRSQAIDVLRGVALALMIVVNTSLNERTSYGQLRHAVWNGLTLADLVFPTFLFVVGAALSFTLEDYQRRGDAATLLKIATRAALIFLCGFLLDWFPYFYIDADGHCVLTTIAEARIFGVLQRIALGYGCAALIVHYGGRAGAVVFSVVALLGYWALLHAFGDYSLSGNAALKLDKFVLGTAHMYHGEGVTFDPEGILSTLPAVVNVIGGYLAGRFVRERGPNFAAIAQLMMVGAACIAIGLALGSVFPINKKLWTSSYVVCTVGIDVAVLALLVYAIDLCGRRDWGFFFEVFGRNALFVYVLSEAGNSLIGVVHVGQESVFDWANATAFQSWAGDKPGSLAYALACMLACWLIAYALDRKRIYIRL
jgi:predicted acyltransferase